MHFSKAVISLLIFGFGLAKPAHSNASLVFNGVNSESVLDGSYLDGGNHTAYTFDLWIKPTTLGGTILGKSEYWKEWTLDTMTDGGLMLRGAWPYNYWGSEVGPNSIKAGVWQNIACSVNNGQAAMYVNGILVGIETVQSPISFRADASIGIDPYFGINGVMQIGCSDSGTTPDYSFFNGAIYGIRVWDRSLSSAEINVLATSGLVPTSGLKNAVLLDEGSGTTFHDSLTPLAGRVLSAQWSSDSPFSAVPEPSTYLAGLSALGMLVIFGLRNHHHLQTSKVQ